MSRRKRRTFAKEQKADAVRLVRTSGESIYQVARSLGIGDNSLRQWVKQADIDAGKGPEGAWSTASKITMCLSIRCFIGHSDFGGGLPN